MEKQKQYQKHIIYKDEILKRRLVKFTVGVLLLFVLILAFGCESSRHIPASTNEGEVLDVYRDYFANVYLRGERGIADINTFFSVKFPYKVDKKDEILIITRRHLDSLLSSQTLPSMVSK